MKQRKPIKRRVRVKPVNPKRRRKRQQVAFGGDARLDWIHRQECFVMRYFSARGSVAVVAAIALDGNVACGGPIEAMHTKSRGAGGSANHVVPCCQKHHAEFHAHGTRSTESKYGVSLAMAADLYDALWELNQRLAA